MIFLGGQNNTGDQSRQYNEVIKAIRINTACYSSFCFLRGLLVVIEEVLGLLVSVVVTELFLMLNAFFFGPHSLHTLQHQHTNQQRDKGNLCSRVRVRVSGGGGGTQYQTPQSDHTMTSSSQNTAGISRYHNIHSHTTPQQHDRQHDRQQTQATDTGD